MKSHYVLLPQLWTQQKQGGSKEHDEGAGQRVSDALGATYAQALFKLWSTSPDVACISSEREADIEWTECVRYLLLLLRLLLLLLLLVAGRARATIVLAVAIGSALLNGIQITFSSPKTNKWLHCESCEMRSRRSRRRWQGAGWPKPKKTCYIAQISKRQRNLVCQVWVLLLLAAELVTIDGHPIAGLLGACATLFAIAHRIDATQCGMKHARTCARQAADYSCQLRVARCVRLLLQPYRVHNNVSGTSVARNWID